MSTLLHGRYRMEAPGRLRPTIAVDVESAARVLLPEDPGAGFLHRMRLRSAAASLTRDPRFVRAISEAPVVLPCPTGWTVYGVPPVDRALRITVVEAVDAALELIALRAMASDAGARVETADVVFTRDASGALVLGVIAPMSTEDETDPAAALFGLLLASQLIGGVDLSSGVMYERVTADAPPRELLEALIDATPQYDGCGGARTLLVPRRAQRALERVAAFGTGGARMNDALAAIDRPASPRGALRFDVDAAIALGEGVLERVPPPHASRKTHFDLAALLHHRACVAMEHGRDAIADLERTVFIDGHPEYLTSLAIARERRGEPDAARAAHDRAVAAIAEVSAKSNVFDGGHDSRPSFPRRAARSLEARGAFRATRGDREGALADLRASLAMHPSPSVERRLAKLGA